MRVLVSIDPLPAIMAYKDSSVAMMRALVARGHTLSVAYQSGLFIDQGVVKAATTGIDLVTDADLHGRAWWRERSARQDTVLSEVAAVLMRKDRTTERRGGKEGVSKVRFRWA